MKTSPVDQSPHPHRSKLCPQAEPGSRFSLRDSRLQAKGDPERRICLSALDCGHTETARRSVDVALHGSVGADLLHRR